MSDKLIERTVIGGIRLKRFRDGGLALVIAQCVTDGCDNLARGFARQGREIVPVCYEHGDVALRESAPKAR